MFDRAYTPGEDDCGELVNTATVVGQPMHPDGYFLPDVTDEDSWTIEVICPVVCGPCRGGVISLTLQYNGTHSAQVRVVQKKRNAVVFDAVVAPGEQFSFTGTDKHGKLGSEIKVYVDDTLNATIHTSCSQPIGPGLVRGDFEVVAGISKDGGPLCEGASGP